MMGPKIPGELIPFSRDIQPADFFYYNTEIFNPFLCEWEYSSFAVKSGIVTGIGEYRARKKIDLKGRRVVPGLIDAHVHIESSLLTPPEFARLVGMHGTTTVIADPHEIANVCGRRGIEYMLSSGEGLALDIFLMLPSCVPATPLDRGGAVLEADDLRIFLGDERVIGLGEVMNVPGVLNQDPGVMEKLQLFSLVDGHAPLLTGKDLNAYLVSGIQSDHECTSAGESLEKVSRGMYIFVREGSTEKNLDDIIRIITPHNCSRFSFATDDRHVDMLVEEGHIDDCVRKAVAGGLDPALALRMATLSPAERFGLNDRGAIVPGRLADFCTVAPGRGFSVEKTFKRGLPIRPGQPVKSKEISGRFGCTPPSPEDILLAGEGRARVIGLIPGQIFTDNLEYQVSDGVIPDLRRDILKVVVCSRYRDHAVGTALVHGFAMDSGAIASSISHDSHNIIATGADDREICKAISMVTRSGGGMAVVNGKDSSLLPLGCAGLMSLLSYEKVYKKLLALNSYARKMGSTENPFMYLSFLALTVIPHLRVTERGLFDVDSFSDLPVFPDCPP